MELFIAFILGIIAVFIYVSSDDSKYSKILQMYKATTVQNTKVLAEKKALEADLASMKTLVEKYRGDVDDVQEHCARLRKGQRVINNNLQIMRGIAERPQNFSVSIIEGTPPKAKIPAKGISNGR